MSSRDRDWGLPDIRGGDPAPGSSPSGASGGLYGVLQTFLRSPEFVAMARGHGLVPQNPGDIKVTAARDAPDGWLLCDGASYEINSYPRLYQAVGTAYGGDGVLNFKVPDLRGRVPVGVGNGGAGFTTRARGDTGGEEFHQLITNEMPAHNHTVTEAAHAHSIANGTASFSYSNASLGGLTTAANTIYAPTGFAAATDLNTPPAHTVGNTGGGAYHNNMQPFTAVNFVIFAGV